MILETGLSVFHKMPLMVMNVLNKSQPLSQTAVIKIFPMRYLWLMFRIEYLKWSLKRATLSLTFSKQYLMKLFKNRIKQHYVRANQALSLNKTINKEIMKKSRLSNKFLNTKSDIDRKAYNKPCNLCVSLIRRDKKLL